MGMNCSLLIRERKNERMPRFFVGWFPQRTGSEMGICEQGVIRNNTCGQGTKTGLGRETLECNKAVTRKFSHITMEKL